ncbi:MAG: group II truncated hemoglobin, partial [Alishewanella aestuarii]
MFSKKTSNQDNTAHPTPGQTPYQLIGGEAAVRALANRFYDIMATAPEAKELYAIHPLPLDGIRQKFFEFLSGWLGGPALFEQKYGHPRLRARHLPFAVNQQLRDQWMFCMEQALDEVV